MTTFDPAKYKETTREQWQAAAKAWNDWGPLLRAWLGPATEVMLDMAKIGPGSRVLDVAAGAGDQTLQTAARVGPNGYVLATDISSKILEFAARSARAAGHANVETKVLDGENLDAPEASFDAVISRVGLIYFPDQQRALAGMRRALKPGGRVAAIVYSTAESNKFFSIPVSIIRRRANLPPPLPGQPGPFSLGGPGFTGDLMMVAAVLCWAIYTLGSRRLISRHSPVGVTGLSMAFGTLIYVPVMWSHVRATVWSGLGWRTWLSIVYSSIFALGVAYTIWYAGVRQIGSARTSVYSNVIPIVA